MGEVGGVDGSDDLHVSLGEGEVCGRAGAFQPEGARAGFLHGAILHGGADLEQAVRHVEHAGGSLQVGEAWAEVVGWVQRAGTGGGHIASQVEQAGGNSAGGAEQNASVVEVEPTGADGDAAIGCVGTHSQCGAIGNAEALGAEIRARIDVVSASSHRRCAGNIEARNAGEGGSIHVDRGHCVSEIAGADELSGIDGDGRGVGDLPCCQDAGDAAIYQQVASHGDHSGVFVESQFARCYRGQSAAGVGGAAGEVQLGGSGFVK